MAAASGSGSEDKRRTSEVDDNDEDPLVIDEEKPPEDEDGNDEENEKEFEPTVDMIMNEFDDERTIEEEEALGQEDEDEEILALEKEQDMPIEELLKLYGYNNSQKEAVEKPVEETEKKEESDQEEIVEPDVEVEPPQEIIVDASKGEKRGSTSPPPSKKARSELAKFYEATVEGRSLRSSAGAPEEEEEESGDEEVEEGKDYSWKKTIMIGPTYQASVPAGLCRAFETGLRVYGKDFHSIQNQKMGTRSVGELVQFYYLWKKTERHDVFANSFRIEKKKYTLHPGTTDYMERFMDEQEVGRDRSASPNYHSLIYGDVKKKSDSRADSLSNGSNERSETGSDPGVAGVHPQESSDCGLAVAAGVDTNIV